MSGSGIARAGNAIVTRAAARGQVLNGIAKAGSVLWAPAPVQPGNPFVINVTLGTARAANWTTMLGFWFLSPSANSLQITALARWAQAADPINYDVVVINAANGAPANVVARVTPTVTAPNTWAWGELPTPYVFPPNSTPIVAIDFTPNLTGTFYNIDIAVPPPTFDTTALLGGSTGNMRSMYTFNGLVTNETTSLQFMYGPCNFRFDLL